MPYIWIGHVAGCEGVDEGGVGRREWNVREEADWGWMGMIGDIMDSRMLKMKRGEQW